MSYWLPTNLHSLYETMSSCIDGLEFFRPMIMFWLINFYKKKYGYYWILAKETITLICNFKQWTLDYPTREESFQN